jgi:hypothetical protein
MRVRTWIEVEQEVEVNVSAADVTQMLSEEPDGDRAAMMGLNNCAFFMRAIPDTIIAEMSEEKRAIIRGFLEEQAARYSVSTQTASVSDEVEA